MAAFAFIVGAVLLRADERCAETLGLSAKGVLTPFYVTHVSILTPEFSTWSHDQASLRRDAPLPIFRRIGTWLSPDTSSARKGSASELVRCL